MDIPTLLFCNIIKNKNTNETDFNMQLFFSDLQFPLKKHANND